MDIKVDINPEDINNLVVQSILDSTLGEAIKKGIEENIKSLSEVNKYSSTENALQKIIRQEVSNIILNMLRTEYEDKIKELIRTVVTDDILKEVTAAAWNKLVDKKY